MPDSITGNTTDSDSVILGSNPSRAAKQTTIVIYFALRRGRLNHYSDLSSLDGNGHTSRVQTSWLLGSSPRVSTKRLSLASMGEAAGLICQWMSVRIRQGLPNNTLSGWSGAIPAKESLTGSSPVQRAKQSRGPLGTVCYAP